MEETMKSLRTIIGLIVVALISCGCDSDQDIPGNNNPPVYCTDKSDNNNCVEPDTTESPPGDDVWVGEDTDPEEDTEAKLDLFELCGGYVGLWDCTMVEGDSKGFFVIILIEPLDILEYQHTFWLEYVQPTGIQGTFVCNGPPPAETGTGGYFYPPKDGDNILIIENTNSYTGEYMKMECALHLTN
ncbi:MAG: hypothetical protein ABIJ23_02645 [Candidatus Magasanikbacteria bacterium]